MRPGSALPLKVGLSAGARFASAFDFMILFWFIIGLPIDSAMGFLIFNCFVLRIGFSASA